MDAPTPPDRATRRRPPPIPVVATPMRPEEEAAVRPHARVVPARESRARPAPTLAGEAPPRYTFVPAAEVSRVRWRAFGVGLGAGVLVSGLAWLGAKLLGGGRGRA